MGWMIFWAIVVLYWVVAFKRLPVYYKRWYEYYDDVWGSIQTERTSQKGAAWISIGLMFVWPFYEGGRLVRDFLISSMTAEERKQAEYEKAAKIVEDYQKQKEREEKEAFDRAMKEEW